MTIDYKAYEDVKNELTIIGFWIATRETRDGMVEGTSYPKEKETQN